MALFQLSNEQLRANYLTACLKRVFGDFDDITDRLERLRRGEDVECVAEDKWKTLPDWFGGDVFHPIITTIHDALEEQELPLLERYALPVSLEDARRELPHEEPALNYLDSRFLLYLADSVILLFDPKRPELATTLGGWEREKGIWWRHVYEAIVRTSRRDIPASAAAKKFLNDLVVAHADALMRYVPQEYNAAVAISEDGRTAVLADVVFVYRREDRACWEIPVEHFRQSKILLGSTYKPREHHDHCVTLDEMRAEMIRRLPPLGWPQEQSRHTPKSPCRNEVDYQFIIFSTHSKYVPEEVLSKVKPFVAPAHEQGQEPGPRKSPRHSVQPLT